ncbi:hypothetical protein EVJ58_g4409 [Rhodofomes roseus]|uniref:BTB domain-containing protein n=1 Tax=Rhodofomes roseus TaxID=34475 RepID=A0A4Y9YJG8_9APHY|nr:hypothetical protein EVJ58_g4409 [Rhodofomes roseus]
MLDYFDFDMQLSAGSSADSDAEYKFLPQTPVRTPTETPVSGNTPNELSVSVSRTFHPYTSFNNRAPDIVFISRDDVFFYVHCSKVLAASDNGFAMLLPTAFEIDGHLPAVATPEPANVLGIILHIVYGLSVSGSGPSLETISATLDVLPQYGFSSKQHARAGMPLCNLLAACAPLRPIDTYALAAKHDLIDAAIAASAHLLAFPLASLTDELATRVGSLYLKRLFFLHIGRIEALKHLLSHLPSHHPDTAECSDVQQRCLARAWALGVAHIMWDAGPSE